MNQSPPDEQPDIDKIVNAVRVVVRSRPGARATRDVHAKQHGLLQAELRILDEARIPERLRHGVFAGGGAPRSYLAWVRFSSSNKRLQSDSVADGRGVAIKLLGVAGARPALARDASQPETQDFILLNGPAFFARNAADMVVAAELEAKDEFPSAFFLRSGARLAGLTALLRMASAQADTPLGQTYFSQTPYYLGPPELEVADATKLAVKYRLTPKSPAPAVRVERTGDHYLFEGLQQALAAGDFTFSFQIQEWRPGFPVDDATAVWDEEQSPFIEVAELLIRKQTLDTERRMKLAESIAYNPWHCLLAHQPLGSINRARLHAYRASRELRQALRGAPELDYTSAEWHAEQAAPDGPKYRPPALDKQGIGLQLLRGLSALFPALGRGLLQVLASRWGYLLAPALLLLIVVWGTWLNPTLFCEPLMLGLGGQPSERMIPPAKWSERFDGRSEAQIAQAVKDDLRWVFRYTPTGSELNGGLPYWVYRALPRMFPERFGERGWASLGLQDRDDAEFYESYHDLPRGLVLSDTVVNLGGTQLGLKLKRVSFNCATCHRGQYLDERGEARFIDGMPNVAIDTARFKQVVFDSFRDPRFTFESLTAEIDALLAEEHQRVPQLSDGTPTAQKLTALERFLYRAIVIKAKQDASAKDLSWMAARPHNGPGRLDAFGALRFEFMKLKDLPKAIATVDLPSIWQQGPRFRTAHHWDGNTQQTRARNFGAIFGVGGTSASVRKEEVLRIGEWIDELGSPKYPFKRASPETLDSGRQIFEEKCAKCHGRYDNGQLSGAAPCMVDKPLSPAEIGTDAERASAFDESFARELNAFGARGGLWGGSSFSATRGYLCPPLDGIWARAPYLHNGSVPSLWFLLGEASERPARFVRGNLRYDQEQGGFLDEPPEDRSFFWFETAERGNAASGHAGPDQLVLEPERRRAVIAYLLTL